MFESDKDISHLTTFNIPVRAKLFAEYSSVKELTKISRSDEFINNPVLHIGGGSNLLFINDFNGLVLHSAIKGITTYRKDENTMFVIAGAGEKWTDLVDWCMENNLAGLENLSGIPGEVGASAVQNVGAYGVEAKDVIHSVECFDTETRTTRRFSNEECHFDYRDSFFKHEGKGRYFVLRVSFKVKENGDPQNLEYGPLKNLESRLGRKPTISEVAEEVKTIRDSKLPNPAVLGSAGSFFKNPVVGKYFYDEEIKPYHPDLPVFHVGEHLIKLSAAWMIDHAGLKGSKVGGAEVYDKQPLVIVNTGNATAHDVKALAELIIDKVSAKYKVNLSPEVNFIDTTIDVTVLGSGTSKGIPEVGCRCPVCTSTDIHDKRLRSSVLVRVDNLNILIDNGPDFRQQALANGINRIDAVLVTHSHYDHVGGIDDLRPLCGKDAMPIFVRKDVDYDLRKRYDYCFRTHPYPGVPALDLRIIDGSEFYIDGVRIIPINVNHGKLPIFGYRIGNFAYITDAKTIDECEMEKLYGVKVLIINALRFKEHFAHLCVDEALDIINKIKPERAYLTHFSHDIGLHSELEKRLPDNVHPAYDGLRIHVS